MVLLTDALDILVLLRPAAHAGIDIALTLTKFSGNFGNRPTRLILSKDPFNLKILILLCNIQFTFPYSSQIT